MSHRSSGQSHHKGFVCLTSTAPRVLISLLKAYFIALRPMRVSAQPLCIRDVHHDVHGSLIFGVWVCPLGPPLDFHSHVMVLFHPRALSSCRAQL